jgi:hypothetical protein
MFDQSIDNYIDFTGFEGYRDPCYLAGEPEHFSSIDP